MFAWEGFAMIHQETYPVDISRNEPSIGEGKRPLPSENTPPQRKKKQGAAKELRTPNINFGSFTE